MRNKKVIFAILACALCSCQAPVVETSSEASLSSEARVYEAFGSYTAQQVEEICRTYAERIGSSVPDEYYLKFDFGTYGNMHVNALKHESPGFADLCMIEPYSVAGYHICDFPYPSYDMNVWIEGEGSFDLETLYLQRKITDENIRSIMAKAEELRVREHKTFDIKAESFRFSFTWGAANNMSYNSEAGLITIKGMNNEYTASFTYPNLNELYEKVKALDIYSYADVFYPYLQYGGIRPYQTPALFYTIEIGLEIGSKRIAGDDCVNRGYGVPENTIPQGKKFLDLVFEIEDTIENSDEFKSIEIPEDDQIRLI